MKTKTVFLIAIAAVVTLSFTFAGKKKQMKAAETASAKPMQGHVSARAL